MVLRKGISLNKNKLLLKFVIRRTIHVCLIAYRFAEREMYNDNLDRNNVNDSVLTRALKM